MNGIDDIMKNDLISIIVPIYKVEKYLRRCVESIINQDYSNLEIILVDDGSPDSCPQICDEYAAKDERIRVVHKTNGGLSDARNLGIAIANGRYIMLIDGDDYINPQMADRMLARIEKDHTDLVICPYQYVDDNGNYIRPDLMAYCKLKNEILTGYQLLGKINFNESGYWFYSNPCSKLYKSSILKKYKYPKHHLFEDEYMIHHLLDGITVASIMENRLYMRTQRPDSITQSHGYDSLKRIDIIYALEDRYIFFKKRGYSKFAKDTADLLYVVFLKIVDNAFKKRKDYLQYFGKMMKITLIQLCEFKNNGVKLPFIYFKSFIKLCIRRS